jgi:hypothetical protein
MHAHLDVLATPIHETFGLKPNNCYSQEKLAGIITIYFAIFPNLNLGEDKKSESPMGNST